MEGLTFVQAAEGAEDDASPSGSVTEYDMDDGMVFRRLLSRLAEASGFTSKSIKVFFTAYELSCTTFVPPATIDIAAGLALAEFATSGPMEFTAEFWTIAGAETAEGRAGALVTTTEPGELQATERGKLWNAKEVEPLLGDIFSAIGVGVDAMD